MIDRKKFITSVLALTAVACLPMAVHAQTMESKLRRMGQTKTLKLEDLRAVRRNNLLTVQATLVNQAQKDMNINYRFKWLDNSGMKAADDEVWNPRVIYAGQTFELTGIAPTPMATDFMIEIEGFN
ncbi:MAG: YcfL family protein [Rhodoluna sp.]